MAKRSMRWALLMVACVAGIIMAGCGEAPNAPTLQGVSAGASEGLPVLAVSPDGSVAYDSVGTGARLESLFVDTLQTSTSRALKVSARIGPLGGVLRAGRFVLNVPPNAFGELATVTMLLPDSTMMLCDMDISPSYLNAFATSVNLSLDTSGLPVKPSDLSIYWYDPTWKIWVDMHPLADDAGHILDQSLSHFSTYAGGKAGW